MAARPGLTVPEILVASALGAFVIAIAIQQMSEYFRLQQVLSARVNLRHDLTVAQDRIHQKLRYVDHVYMTPDGTFATIPRDTCPDGYLCDKDLYEVLWWRVVSDPLDDKRRILQEQSIEVPAFGEPPDPGKLKELFAKAKSGHGHRLASSIESLTIEYQGPVLHTVLVAAQQLDRRQEPVAIRAHGHVATRSKPVAQGLPSLDERLEDLAWKP